MILQHIVECGDEMARMRVRSIRGGGTGSTTSADLKLLATDVQKLITRAKREWEGTVDALGDVVCLLDASTRIVRANRVVERWGLGKVSLAIGRTPHELLHPDCTLSRCPLTSALRRAWKSLKGDELPEFEHHSTDNGAVWHVSLRPLRPSGAASRGRGETLAVLVVSNVSELHRAHLALEWLNSDLETRVQARTRELADANRDLRNEVARREAAEQAQRIALSELARLSEELITAQEHERRRIAIELHDSVGQSLTAVKYSLERAMTMRERPGTGDSQTVLALAIDGVQQAAESIRAIAMNLRPSVLDDMGAASAIAWFCRKFAEVYPTIRVKSGLSAADAAIPDRLGTTVFRSAQELLNNVAKHSGATEVSVDLRRDGALLWLEVRDDGIGFPDNLGDGTRTGGHGIRNLRERAEMTGGQFSIGPASPGGTVARISWRLMKAEAGDGEGP
jgi:signal transduction histidine kinase